MCPALNTDILRATEEESFFSHRFQDHGLSVHMNWKDAARMHSCDDSDPNIEDEAHDLAARRKLSIHVGHVMRTTQLVVDFDGQRPIPRLREPLDLFNFPSASCPFQGVRWPIEFEVIKDVIHHIEWEPPGPESFYQLTGHERTPIPVGEEKGKVVYCIDLATKTPYFTRSRVGGSRRPIKSAITCATRQGEPTLEFESRFESGNLQKATQVGVHDYELTLRTDTYTNKHTQWFYFRVRNMKAGATYRFTIINLMKCRSLYSLGLKPLLYSERADKERGVGWHRIGSNIRYYRNCSQGKEDNNTLYSLTWTCHFPYDSDTCYLAHCYPYTYSRLQCYLGRVTSDPAVAAYCKLRVLCRSLAGNMVYVLTVTSPGGGGSRAERRRKKAVVVTARVHPGETNSSWMMEGFLDFLLGDSDDAQVLRDTFVFKVVPMLNPDGVVVGNYRCSLAGRDLNRNYRTMLRESFPCVWHMRSMVKRLMAERDVALYCDFHGHSRKNNVFMYGCNNRDDATLQLHERVFPLMMSKNANDKFSFRSCKFRVQKSKEGTGRIVMWRLGIRNSYTMESTFGGSTLGNRSGTHFTTQDLKSLGYYFCDTLLDYCDPDPTKTAYCLTELSALLKQEVRERLGKELGTDCSISISDLESSTSGSNSTDSDGLPVHLLNQANAIQTQKSPIEKKKHLRTRKERNRLRQERIKKNTEPIVLHSSIKNLEPNLLSEDEMIKMRIQKTALRNRKRKKVPCGAKGDNLMRKPAVPRSASGPRLISHVTLRQDPEHVKNKCLEAMRASYRHHRTKAYPQLRLSLTKPSQSEEPEEERGRCRYSTQLLHLHALLPPQTGAFCPPPVVSHKGLRGRLPDSLSTAYRSPSGLQYKVVPEIVPSRVLEPSISSTLCPAKSSPEQPHVDKNASWFSTSQTNTIKYKIQEKDGMEVGVSLLDNKPISGQDQRELILKNPLYKSEPDGNSYSHRLRSTDIRGKRLSKETLKEQDTLEIDVLTTLSKTSGLFQLDRPLSQDDTFHRLQKLSLVEGARFSHTGRGNQKLMPLEGRLVRRPSGSAPLHGTSSLC